MAIEAGSTFVFTYEQIGERALCGMGKGEGNSGKRPAPMPHEAISIQSLVKLMAT